MKSIISILFLILFPIISYSQDLTPTPTPTTLPGLPTPVQDPAPEFKRMHNVGLGYYGIMNRRWNCSASLNVLKKVKVINLSYLWKSFGTETRCLRRFMKDRRMRILETHFINGAGLRNNRLQSYEVAYGETIQSLNYKLEHKDKKFMKTIGIEAALLSNFLSANLNLNTLCLVNLELENDLTYKAGKNLYEYVRPLFPDRCKFVWNQNGAKISTVPNSDFTETHGKESSVAPGAITNLDGTDINLRGRPSTAPSWNYLDESDVQSFLMNRAEGLVNFLWILEFNGVCNGRWVGPRNRECFPSEKLFGLVSNLVVKSQSLPKDFPVWTEKDNLSLKGCKSFEDPYDSIHGGFVWKASDAHSGQLAVLFPSKFNPSKPFKSVTVTKNGKVIDRISHAGTFTENSTQYPRQIWRSLKKPESYPFNVVLHADNVCYILKNPKGRVD